MDFSTIAFRPIQMTDRPWIERCLASARQPFTALTFPSLMTWAGTYGTTIAGDDDFFVIRSRHDKGYYMPCGLKEKCLAFMEERAEKEQPARFVYVPETIAWALEAEGWHILYRGDLSEYILNTEALAMTEGYFITHSYKYKVRHFSQRNRYRAREITPEDLPALRRVRDGAAMVVDTSGPADAAVLDFEIEHFRELGLRGVLVETEEGNGAFFLGYEQQPGIFTATMVRHDAALPEDVTAVCLYEFSKILRAEYPRINIEEDLGLGGLRMEKTLYSPVDLTKVYEALK